MLGEKLVLVPLGPPKIQQILAWDGTDLHGDRPATNQPPLQKFTVKHPIPTVMLSYVFS